MKFEAMFEKCIKRRNSKSGRSIRCRFGLWRVSGPDPELVEAEAKRYWVQYFEDGEYASVCGGPK